MLGLNDTYINDVDIIIILTDLSNKYLFLHIIINLSNGYILEVTKYIRDFKQTLIVRKHFLVAVSYSFVVYFASLSVQIIDEDEDRF